MRNITYFKVDAAEIQESWRELSLKVSKTLKEYYNELQSLLPDMSTWHRFQDLF